MGYAISNTGMRAVDVASDCSSTETFYSVLPSPWPPAATLLQLQTAQIASVQSAEQAAIAAGFKANALGAATTYPLDSHSERMLLAAYNAAVRAEGIATAWSASESVAALSVSLVSGSYLLAITAGVTGSSAPVPPSAYKTPITDGTVSWELAGYLLNTGAGAQWHSVQEVIAVYQAYLVFLNAQAETLAALSAEINAATTTAAVQAVVWP